MATKKRAASSFHQIKAPLLFLAPNVIIFIIFIIYPALSGIKMSFYDWSILGDTAFAGFSNYKYLINDEMFWKTLGNSLRFVVMVVPLLTIAALGVALLVAGHEKGIGLYRGLYYIPTLLSFVIVGISWRWLLGDEIGVINYIIKLSGGTPQRWLTSPLMANISLVFITVWCQTGFYMVMFVGGLQAIPGSLYEAAKIDGANTWQMFTKIKFPMIRPTTLVVMVLATINAFKAFELIFVLTKGGPGVSTKFLVQNIYQVAFEEDKLGYAAAQAVILMMVIGILTFVQFKLNGKEHDNE